MTAILFAGGGTGGHLYPGLALAEALRAASGLEPHFLTGDRPVARRILERSGFGAHYHPAWSRGGLRRWFDASRSVLRIFRELEPVAVVGLGGGESVLPVVRALAGWRPLFLIEQNRALGRANRLLAGRARRVFLAHDDTPLRRGVRRRALRLGCPVRGGFRPMPFPEGLPSILVLGGSQGSDAINRLVEKALPAIAPWRERFRITHLAGADETAAQLARSYERHGIAADVRGFLDDPAPVLAAASLVVSRAGGSTCAELEAVGRGALLLPYPHHRDRHQFRNAEALVEAGGARVVSEDPVAFAAHLQELLEHPTRLCALARAARARGRPDAALRIAEVISTHLERAPAGAAAGLPLAPVTTRSL